MRRLVQANLEAYGLEVRGAVEGHHVLSVLDDDPPDLILLDTDLPDFEVGRVLDRLQARMSQQVPIIVIAAELPSRDARTDVQSVSYLLKPFAVPALLQQVQQALDGRPTDAGTTTETG
jgi:DNA-binding response OmpR family regulator